MFIISRLFENPILYLIVVISVIFGLTIHEYFHGWTAYMLGDDTAKMAGRLTVNPLTHFDPILTTMIFIIGLGAAKPVPIDPYKIRHGRFGVLLVSLAGILANFFSAVIFAIIYKVLIMNGTFPPSNLIFVLLEQLIVMNLVLMVFNLIPLPPLDGSKVLLMIIHDKYESIYRYFAQNQILSLILAIMLFSFVGIDLINFFYNVIFRII
ncbi:MAG: site-2 protease family protein [bacterium]